MPDILFKSTIIQVIKLFLPDHLSKQIYDKENTGASDTGLFPGFHRAYAILIEGGIHPEISIAGHQ
jgi:hypothetical protein